MLLIVWFVPLIAAAISAAATLGSQAMAKKKKPPGESPEQQAAAATRPQTRTATSAILPSNVSQLGAQVQEQAAAGARPVPPAPVPPGPTKPPLGAGPMPITPARRKRVTYGGVTLQE